MDIFELQKILQGSKEYTFNGTKLTITAYYTGKKVKLDLGKLNQSMVNTLMVDDTEEED